MMLQSWRRPVHFLVMSIMARHNIFSRLSSIDQLPDFLGILEISTESRPVSPPRAGNLGVFLIPALGKGFQGIQGRPLIHSPIHRLFHHLSLASDMVVDGVQEYHRINALRRPLLPFFCHRKNFVRDTAHCCF